MSGHEQLGIGAVARETGLSVRAIRYYEDVGLIHAPPRHDPGAHTGGNRRYDAATVGRLRFIRQARALGLGLSEIRRLATLLDHGTCPGGAGALHEMLERHREAIERHIDELRALHARIEAVLAGTSTASEGACGESGCKCLDASPPPALAWSGRGIESVRLVDEVENGQAQ